MNLPERHEAVDDNVIDIEEVAQSGGDEEFFEVLEVEHLRTKTLRLGDEEVECYMLPNGEYRWSMNQASTLIGMPRYWLRDTLRSPGGDNYKRLEDSGFKGDIIRVVPKKKGINPPHLISTPDFQAMIVVGARNYSLTRAWALLQTSLYETLERRADHAFGVVRSEEEYHKKFEARFLSIVFNKELRAAIGEWIRARTKENVSQYLRARGGYGGEQNLYKFVGGYIYQLVFGMYKKDVNKLLGLPGHRTLRDTVEPNQVRNVAMIEEMAAKYLRKGQVAGKTVSGPFEAVQLAGEYLLIEVEQPRLGDIVTTRQVHNNLSEKDNEYGELLEFQKSLNRSES